MSSAVKSYISYGSLVGTLLFSNILLNASYSSNTQLVIAALTVMVLLGIARLNDLGIRDIGISKRTSKKGILHGGIAGLLIVAILVIVFIVLPTVYLDERYNQSWRAAFMTLFIYLPIRTVLVEEVAFRGVLLSMGQKIMSFRQSMIASSLLFGMWHILPSRSFAAIDLPILDVKLPAGFVIFGIVILTSIAGMIFCQARKLSGSIITPILIHWSLNACAIVLATLAWNG